MAKQVKKKRQQNNNVLDGILTVGLDIGYGVVKVVTDDRGAGLPLGHGTCP